MSDFKVTTNTESFDIEMIHNFLSTSYWAKGRTVAEVEKTIKNSLSFGGFVSGKQVAFGRVVTDKVVFGYLADVFVLSDYRGRNYGRMLVAEILQHQDIKGLTLHMLATRDAHGLYEKMGFNRIKESEKLMAIFGNEGN